MRQVRTCALAIWPARRACPIVRRRRRERCKRLQALILQTCQNAPRGRKISLAWTNFSSHGRYLESRTTGLHSGREGRGWGSGMGQRRRCLPSPMFSLRVDALQWRSCCIFFLSPLRRAMDPGYDPGVHRTGTCMIWPAVLAAIVVASSCMRAAEERI